MGEKKLRRMMKAMAEAHDANVSEREKGAALALRCGNGMATGYWRQIALAAEKAMRPRDRRSDAKHRGER